MSDKILIQYGCKLTLDRVDRPATYRTTVWIISVPCPRYTSTKATHIYIRPSLPKSANLPLRVHKVSRGPYAASRYLSVSSPSSIVSFAWAHHAIYEISLYHIHRILMVIIMTNYPMWYSRTERILARLWKSTAVIVHKIKVEKQVEIRRRLQSKLARKS